MESAGNHGRSKVPGKEEGGGDGVGSRERAEGAGKVCDR